VKAGEFLPEIENLQNYKVEDCEVD